MMVVVFEFSTAVFVSHSDIGEAEKVEYNYQNLNSLPPKPEEKISRSTFCKSKTCLSSPFDNNFCCNANVFS